MINITLNVNTSSKRNETIELMKLFVEQCANQLILALMLQTLTRVDFLEVMKRGSVIVIILNMPKRLTS